MIITEKEITPRTKGEIYMYAFSPLSRINSFFDAVNDYETEPKVSACRTDIIEEDERYIMEAELPGFAKEEISIDLNGTDLTIKAAHTEKTDDKRRYVRRERSRTAYHRSFDISGIDTDNIGAEYKNGILVLTLPKKKATVPPVRKLEIQ